MSVPSCPHNRSWGTRPVDPVDAAAALAAGVLRRRPFPRANAAVAWLCLVQALALNGVLLPSGVGNDARAAAIPAAPTGGGRPDRSMDPVSVDAAFRDGDR